MDADTLSKRRKFTIRCTAEEGVIIEDGNGRKGGNVRARHSRQLSWRNDTDQPVCYLKFLLVPDEDTEESGEPDWPFAEDAPPEHLLELPQGAWTTRTLKRSGRTECFEYVVLNADKAPLLDPVIIIDPN